VANPAQLKILENEPGLWNQWRLDNPGEEIDLSRAYLSGANFEGFNFRGANLSMGANLSGTCLRNANFSGANLT